ncbi:hypothetical protein EVJ20_14005 [Exiguobacterium sp. SH0S1]|uniref:DUF6241 domain-containing protein n=1 Tax=Exiguobacterium sp. SH0S1 TaxID=2510949 RepID=UPI00103C3F9A|nr:DUF6241 domain-containing protein [Exiguobacterium sp. SH0S1]TCI75638.1 hypothetical protein EVJ20_14005 [Exiguobacterium sp. SH0S1]
MSQKLRRVFTPKRLIILLSVFILLIPVFFVSYTFYKNLSPGVKNEDLDDKYAKRVKELQIEVSKEDPLNRRGNSTEKTRVELDVSYDEKKPSRTDLIKSMHLMTHQKISARAKWGAIPMTPENIKLSSDYLELLKVKNKVGNDVYEDLRTMLDNWSQGDFSKANDEQDQLLDFLQANRGFSNGLATQNEEELFILNNFGPEYLNTLDKDTYTSYELPEESSE